MAKIVQAQQISMEQKIEMMHFASKIGSFADSTNKNIQVTLDNYQKIINALTSNDLPALKSQEAPAA